MIQVKVSVSQCECEESGTVGRGQNWKSDAMQRKQKDSRSSGGAEQYEGDEARQFDTRVQRAAKLRSEANVNR